MCVPFILCNSCCVHHINYHEQIKYKFKIYSKLVVQSSMELNGTKWKICMKSSLQGILRYTVQFIPRRNFLWSWMEQKHVYSLESIFNHSSVIQCFCFFGDVRNGYSGWNIHCECIRKIFGNPDHESFPNEQILFFLIKKSTSIEKLCESFQ